MTVEDHGDYIIQWFYHGDYIIQWFECLRTKGAIPPLKNNSL